LKLENTERTSSDLRLKANELAERYGESQRELTRLHEEVIKMEDNVNINNEQLLKSNEINQILNIDNKELTSKINNITENYTHEIKDLNEQIMKLNNKYLNYEKDNNNHIHELQNEVNSLNNRLKIESESAGNLDNYKKRAQLALQKVSLYYYRGS
jgi:phage host-nuclease inhibitor protein Gam